MSKYRTINRLRRAVRHVLAPYLPAANERGRASWAECGEDLMIERALGDLGVEARTYLDIGAHQPRYLSNTFYFYQKGFSGVCVEADPDLCRDFKRIWPRDVVVNAGIGVNGCEAADFFIMTFSTLSTFSKEWAERVEREQKDVRIERVIRIPLMTINQILDRYSLEAPAILSLDIEGWDNLVIRTLDFTRYRPSVICIEGSSLNGSGECPSADYLCANGYAHYADTHVNSIFARAC